MKKEILTNNVDLKQKFTRRCPNCYSEIESDALECRICRIIIRSSCKKINLSKGDIMPLADIYTTMESYLRGRQYERIVVNARAVVILNRTIKIDLRLKDISARGFRGLSTLPLKTNNEIEVILLYPFFDNFVKKTARVIWSKEKKKNLWEAGFDFGIDNKIDLSNYLKFHSA